MRKITFLWMFLLLIGTVHAQQPITSDAPVDGKWAENTTWYFIQFVNSDSYHTNGYLATKGGSYINNNGVLLLNGTTKPVNNAGLWCVVGNETDGYKFYNKGKGTGFVLGMTGGTAKMYETTTTETVSTNFDYAASTATFTGDLANGSYATYKIHGTENDYWNNSDGAPKCHLSIWSDSRALRDPGSAIQFTQVTADELTQICPIQPTTITDGAFAEDTQWYRLVINRDPKKYSKFDKINNVTANSTEKTTDRNSFFCFVADPNVDNGFKIYNMAAGTKKAFTSTGTNNEICTYSETGTTFVLEKNTSGADGYQFRVNGFDRAYFNDVYGQIGVWNPDNSNASTDAGGTFMIIEGTVTAEELASLTVDFTELNTLVALAEQYTIGSGVGQYVDNSGGTFATALAAAKDLDHGRTDIAYQTTIDDAMETLQAAMTQLSINIPATGKYYRMRVASQSAANDNYMSAYGNGDYLNTKVSENDVPTIFYLTTDGKLQAVYNDRYIKSAESAGVLEMTANTDEAMVWDITGSTSVPGTYRLKAGVTNMYLYDWTTYNRNYTRIMAEENGARCQWTIEEVTLDEEAVKAFDLGLMSACQALETILLVADAELTYPTEYTYTPAELNAALTEIKGVTAANTLAEVKAALNSEAFTTAQHYKGLCDSYGKALSVTCEFKGQYNTVIMPINFTRPAAWTTYECATTDGNQLVLTENTAGVDKNIPFIVEYTDEATMPTPDAPKVYQFIGYENGAGTENVTTGCLTGVMTAATTIPEGSYVLALNKTTGKQAFYLTDGTVICPQYKCYFTAPASASPAKAFYFDNNGETTGIESIFGGNDGEVVIYNIAGQRINKLQKGINIVNGRKVLVK